MRCKNCGWQNPDGLSNCERCGSSLEGMSAPSGATDSGHENYYGGREQSSPLHATIREASTFDYQNGSSSSSSFNRQDFEAGEDMTCHSCGYRLSPNMNVCPQCGTSLRHQSKEHEAHQPTGKKQQAMEKHCSKCGATLAFGARFCPSCGQPLRMTGTVNAWDNPQGNAYCSLRPLPWARENTDYAAISFSGERIILNRANTDPNNQSITSREQAVLTHDGNNWYIEDLSEQHSTMIRVSRKTKLQSGDVIALGNRLFEFKD